MPFFLASSPYHHQSQSLSTLMKWLLICALPGLATQSYFFGWGSVIQIAFAMLIATIFEAGVMLLRKRSVINALKDGSAFVSAWLLAIAIPPLSPWWILVIGLFFAIVIAKHLYGGLGQNLFNPAMVAYVVLLISFPLPMTSWIAPSQLAPEPTEFADAFSLIFKGFTNDGFSLQQFRTNIDGMTMATPLDAFKSAIHAGESVFQAFSHPIFTNSYGIEHIGIGWVWVNIAYLLGGLWLLQRRIIQWHIPCSFLFGLIISSGFAYFFIPCQTATPFFHLFSGATMLGAFFIATDPVTASTTVKGRLYYGFFIGVMVFVIRTWGSFPDGVAFAILLANISVPLIDYYTKPRTYGH